MRKPASEYDLLPLPSSLQFLSIALALTHARGRACKPRRVREQRLGRLFTHNTHKHRRARPSYLQLFILDLLPKQADREKKEEKKKHLIRAQRTNTSRDRSLFSLFESANFQNSPPKPPHSTHLVRTGTTLIVLPHRRLSVSAAFASFSCFRGHFRFQFSFSPSVFKRF